MTCPWCGAHDVEQIAPYGTLLMTAQWFCNACGSPFERVRHRGTPDERPHGGDSAGGHGDGRHGEGADADGRHGGDAHGGGSRHDGSGPAAERTHGDGDA